MDDGGGENKKKVMDKRLKQVLGFKSMTYKVSSTDDDDANGGKRGSTMCKTVFPMPLIVVLATILVLIVVTFIGCVVLGESPSSTHINTSLYLTLILSGHCSCSE
jgi:hypothetical protein